MVVNVNQHLEAAPITEAIIDIRIQPVPDEYLARFSTLSKAFQEKYTSQREMRRAGFQLNVQGEGSVDREDNHIGYRHETTDGKRVLQFRTDGFTLSYLNPYSSWEEFRAEAQELFSEFSSKLDEAFITRLSLRYINHLNLPIPCEFSDYLTAPPKVPDNLPQELLGFTTQNIIRCPEHNAVMRLAQSLNGVDNGAVSVLLDIDAINEFEAAIEIKNGSIWKTFDSLRVLKNEAFFGSITEKTKELIE
tara:strand:- start:55 stop:798 length:744 start_codon:yes stop_codon:yes gene_type:complete